MNRCEEKNEDKTVEERDKQKVHFLRELPKNLMTGVLVFIPLIIVVLIIRFSVDTVLSIGSNLLGITKSVELTFVLVLLITLLILYSGYKFRKREQWFLNYLEGVIISIPLIGTWYKIIKDLVSSFSGAGDTEDKYLGVVKVPFGMGYVIGFVTKRKKVGNDVMLTVFMPTSPNPTSGIVLFFPEKEIEYLSMSAEKAFARIISLGVRE